MAGIIDGLTLDEQLQVIYIGYFGRAADGGGFNFWSGQNATAQANGQSAAQALTNIANSFAPQDETLAKYPLLGTANPDFTSPTVQAQLADFINDVYQNLFNRDADAGGLAYWQAEITSGRVGFGAAILAIANGATGDDALIINNKVDAAVDFTTDTALAGLGFTDPLTPAFAAAAAEVLNGVTSDPATVAAAAAETDAFIASGGGSGSVFNLTTGVDSFVGTAGGDVFNAIQDFSNPANSTYTNLDNLDGSTGPDVLNLAGIFAIDTTIASTTVKNIETINASTNGSINIDAQNNFAGVQTINASAPTGGVNILTKANATTVNATALGGTIIDQNNVVGADALATVSLTGSGGYSVISDALASLSAKSTIGPIGATTTNNTANNTLALKVDSLVAGSGFSIDTDTTTLNVTGAGGDSDFSLAAGGAKSVTITGDAGLRVDQGFAGTGATIDASGTTGGVRLVNTLNNADVFTGGSGADDVLLGASTKATAMGGGDDMVELTGAALGVGGTADGGNGTDTLVMTTANAATASAAATFEATISSFERLGLIGADNATVNLANLDDINSVITDGVSGGPLVLNNAGAGFSLETTGSDGDFNVINLTNALGTADTINTKITAAGGIVQAIKAAGVEVFNVESDDTAATPLGGFQHNLVFNGTPVTTLNITGDAGISVSGAGTALTTFNASAMTEGNVTFVADALANAATITTAGGDDVINGTAATKSLTISTGAGIDVIIGGGGNDTINAGDGDDTIVGGLGLDTLTGGAGKDTFAFAAGHSTGATVDVITDFGATDLLSFGIAITYGGEVNGLAAANTALAGGANAVLDTSNNQVYVDLDGSGDVNAGDTIVTLTGVIDLDQTNFV